MNGEDETLIVLTDEDMRREYERLMALVPYETPGQLRDAVFGGGELCCPCCYDYAHPYADAWRGMDNWLYLDGKDWRTVE
ncbi:hypothetical protein OG949_33065 [Streptomyces scopuliridis]|uniref:hypothetical protein n=1 Tax=Streptomyces scopuliridis TaxID=452529 RepID=UPI002DDB89CB|nr:hypothetical protein [Streptomyces scopuliridis]WSB37200.1 hypothetical protein OG949_33065 [Streptomyces scopuliridis]